MNISDNGFLLIVAVVVAAAAAGVVYWGLRKNLPPAASLLLAEAVARVQAELRGVLTDEEVAAFAEKLWDRAGVSASLEGYYTKEQFVALVVRTVMKAIEEREIVATAIGWSRPDNDSGNV